VTAKIEWPIGWRSVPLRTLFRRVKDVGHPDEEMLSVYRDHGVVRKESRSDNFNKTAENRDIYQLVHDGWFVVNRMKAWQGAVGISSCRGIVSGHYICFEPHHDEEARFLNYLLRSGPYATEFARMSRGVRPNQIEINNELLAALVVHLPPVKLQRRIVSHLDRETTRMDRLIAKKGRIAELLEDRSNTGIMDIVGRSELVGQGDVRAAPIRRLLRKEERWVDGGEMITAFRNGQVTSRTARERSGFTNAWTEGGRLQGVEVGDVVIHGLDGFSGAIGDAQMSGVCSPVYHVCTVPAGDTTFYGRLLRLLALNGYLGSFAVSTRERAIDLRNWGLFGHIPIPVVPHELQWQIGDQIRSTRPLLAKIQGSEKLAGERRQALITAAVTGEMEIPGVPA
jgi:type I restriction enzyme S subunit